MMQQENIPQIIANNNWPWYSAYIDHARSNLSKQEITNHNLMYMQQITVNKGNRQLSHVVE